MTEEQKKLGMESFKKVVLKKETTFSKQPPLGWDLKIKNKKNPGSPARIFTQILTSIYYEKKYVKKYITSHCDMLMS